ncbi:patatin-like phospholipase family protein [Blastococcus sp. PRF04-17]|uniref:patatin-like phospholipase family protein n=1 Tax=Blastococcus sp. PRF04-17 TaxID=2933797 RepID=UPI001FF4D8FA|nr:patatin-like phospholipase family protein [Blastococcus sp. PRF04-17]UOY03682.1 patatin-like phospholipase family protein [Blastococcus sp. PRF04-17]
MTERRADLVLEGGGVKGLGTAGAVMGLLDEGWTFPRVAGTSVGALAAAFAAAGADSATLRDVLGRLDLRRIPDRRVPVPLLGEGLSLVAGRGAYAGDWIREWLLRELDRLGVRTFADLRRDDPGADPALATPDHRYSLVVMATDVTHGRLLRLPWDYVGFGLDPDEQLVADAVRMSLSIPFYFRPCELRNAGTGEVATIVDGGVLSNFPIEIFDRTDGVPPRWPTFGVRLLPDLPAGLGDVVPFFGVPMLPTVRLLEQVVVTAIVGRDQTHLERPGVRERTMTVDTAGTAITEFGIGAEERRRLVEEGSRTARDFLGRWPGTAATAP